MGRTNVMGSPFLILRKETGKFDYFRQIPAALQPHMFGQISVPWRSKINAYKAPKTIKIALHTGDDTEALKRRDHIAVQVEDMYRRAEDRLNARQRLELAQQIHTLTQTQITQMGDQVRHDILESDDRAYIGESGSDLASVLAKVLEGITEERTLAAKAEGVVAEQCAQNIEHRVARTQLKRRDITMFDARIEEGEVDASEKLIEKLLKISRIADPQAEGLTLEDDELEELGFTLAPELVPSPVDAILSENGAAMQMGHPDRNRLALDLLRSKIEALRDVRKRRDGEPIRTFERPPLLDLGPDAPRVSEMDQRWVERVKPKRKQRDDHQLYLNAFISVFGDLPITQITKRHVREFRDLLARRARDMPKAIAAKPLRDQIAWTEGQSEPRLIAPGTVNAKGIGTISSLMDIALRDDLISVNPCLGLLLDTDSVERLPYSVVELNLIFSTDIYRSGDRPLGGGGEAAFWIPLIGLFAGARLEEIGQLLNDDIRHAEDIDYFEFTDIDEEAERTGTSNTKKKLKTPAARRKVPIHHILIELGFLDYVARRRREGGKFLFPDLKEYRERRTKNWSRWWSRHTDAFVTQSDRKVFHSLRHNFFERMREITGNEDAGKALGGHSSYMYGRTFSLQKRQAWIRELTYPGLDLAIVRAAAARLAA